MRASDALLAEALRTAGIEALVARAAGGEFNDYFGLHAAPQHALIDELRKVTGKRRANANRLIERVMNGDFDGTPAEADEWAASTEGQDALASLARATGNTRAECENGHPVPIFCARCPTCGTNGFRLRRADEGGLVTWWLLRVHDADAEHVWLYVYAGPFPDNLALLGSLTLRPADAIDLAARLGAGGRLRVEHADLSSAALDALRAHVARSYAAGQPRSQLALFDTGT